MNAYTTVFALTQRKVKETSPFQWIQFGAPTRIGDSSRRRIDSVGVRLRYNPRQGDLPQHGASKRLLVSGTNLTYKQYFMSQIQIRHIAQEDFEGFYSCFDAVARECKFLGFTEAPSPEATMKWLMSVREAGEIRLVALDKSKIIGWCDIETNQREGFTHAGRLGMGILQEYLRQGLGASLLDETLSVARERGLERVELDVYASNIAAIKLYEKFNFQIEERKRKARKLNETYDDIIVMAWLHEYVAS